MFVLFTWQQGDRPSGPTKAVRTKRYSPACHFTLEGTASERPGDFSKAACHGSADPGPQLGFLRPTPPSMPFHFPLTSSSSASVFKTANNRETLQKWNARQITGLPSSAFLRSADRTAKFQTHTGKDEGCFSDSWHLAVEYYIQVLSCVGRAGRFALNLTQPRVPKVNVSMAFYEH